MLVAPGLADNLDAVAMLREAIDEGADAGGTWKNGAPLFVAEVGGDNGGAFLVATRQNIVEHVGGARITRQVAELVEDQQIWAGVAADAALKCRHGFLDQQIGERGGERGEADGEAGDERGLREMLRNKRFAEATGTFE